MLNNHELTINEKKNSVDTFQSLLITGATGRDLDLMMKRIPSKMATQRQTEDQCICSEPVFTHVISLYLLHELDQSVLFD